jgi:hypothetical protein
MTCINPLQAFPHGSNQCCGVEKPTQQEIEDRGFKLTAHRVALDFTDLMFYFRTEKNRFLGIGSESLEIGDVVPYLIRPVNGGEDNKFRFVGEAYFHGIMHSEAMRAEGATVQEIILI